MRQYIIDLKGWAKMKPVLVSGRDTEARANLNEQHRHHTYRRCRWQPFLSFHRCQGLTFWHFAGILSFPNHNRPVVSRSRLPKTAKRAALFYIFCRKNIRKDSFILAGQRPMYPQGYLRKESVRIGGRLWAGERCSAFFYCLIQKPLTTRRPHHGQ